MNPRPHDTVWPQYMAPLLSSQPQKIPSPNQLTLKTQLWQEIESTFIASYKEIHLYVPICIGFQNQMTPEQFACLAQDLESHCQTNSRISYTICIYPNELDSPRVKEWELSVAHIANPLASKGKYFLIAEWREKHKHRRKQAEDNYKTLLENQTGNSDSEETLQSILSRSAHRFLKNNLHIKNQLSAHYNQYASKAETEIALDYAITYLNEEAIDCIALMTPQTETKSELEKITLLVYNGTLNANVVGHVIKKCPNALNCVPNSLYFTNKIKYSFDENKPLKSSSPPSSVKSPCTAIEEQRMNQADYVDYVSQVITSSMRKTDSPELIAKIMISGFYGLRAIQNVKNSPDVRYDAMIDSAGTSPIPIHHHQHGLFQPPKNSLSLPDGDGGRSISPKKSSRSDPNFFRPNKK